MPRILGTYTAIVTPFTMTHLFSYATTGPTPLPGAPFLAAALALLIGALIFSRSRISATAGT